MTNWTNFIVAYLAVFLIFGGAVGFFGFHDKVYHYDYRTAQDSPPQRMSVDVYEGLSPEKQQIVDDAIAGERVMVIVDDEADIPRAPVIRKDGTYHVFNRYATFDWLDQNTLAPMGVFGIGVLLAVFAIKRDVGTKATI